MMEEILDFEKPIAELEAKLEGLRLAGEELVDLSEPIAKLEQQIEQLRTEIYSDLSPWQRTLIARHPQRPHASDYMSGMLTDFVELHGDRVFRDDPSVICGLGSLDGRSIAVIGQEKGRDSEENVYRNFGMPHPEGYAKAMRVMKLAEGFGLPVVTLIDTPGAYPGIEAESRGQAVAIAENLREMSMLRTPILSVIIGEGGSGGALGIAVSDSVWMLENSIYSVISPEGCASILFRDAGMKVKAAEDLKLTARDHLERGLVDGVIPEGLGGAHRNRAETVETVGKVISKNLAELCSMDTDTLVEKRYVKYRNMGVFEEA